jgi:hypothetical protein
VVKLHAADCGKQLNKFAIFVAKNRSMPFHLKRNVLNAALFSAMLYSCETWLVTNTKEVQKHYMAAIKLLLGVRGTSTNLLCLLESGYPEIDSLIMKRRIAFITKFLRNAAGDEPLCKVLDICRPASTKSYKILQIAIDYEGDPVRNNIECLKERCRQRSATSSKVYTYLQLNPELSVHKVYESRIEAIPDHERQAFSRFRLSSHRLRIETGRWARQAREDRLCNCQQAVQDEYHVVFECALSEHIRKEHGIKPNTVGWPARYAMPPREVCLVLYSILTIFK